MAGISAGVTPAISDEDQRESNQMAIQHDVQPLRDGRGETEGREEIGAPRRQDQRGRAAEGSQDQAFGHELPQDPPAAGAERDAHANLALPFRRAGQQQAGNVEARNQQHDPDDRQPDPGDAGDAAQLGHAVADRDERDAAAGVRGRVGQRQLVHDAAQIGLGLRGGDPRFHPACHGQPRFVP